VGEGAAIGERNDGTVDKKESVFLWVSEKWQRTNTGPRRDQRAVWQSFALHCVLERSAREMPEVLPFYLARVSELPAF